MPVRRTFCLLLLLPLLGCGVSKKIWLNEVERREEVEKQLAICEAGQRRQQSNEEALQRDLASAGERGEALAADLAAARKEATELQKALAEVGERERGVRDTLEGCREVRRSVEADRDRLRERLSSEAQARAAASGRTEVVTAESERLRQDLDTEKQARTEAVARGRELAAERDLLSRELQGARERGDASVAEAEGLKTRLAGLEGRLAAVAEERERLEREKAAKVREVERSYEELLKGMKSELEQGQVTISQLRGRLSVNVLDEILFASGRAEINPQGRAVLAKVGEVLKGMEDKTIAIEGHTDSVPVTGQLAKVYPSNWELSAARATSVVRYLESTAGIDPQRLSAVGLGPHHPVDSNATPEGRARNRRIEIKLVPREPLSEEATAGEPAPAPAGQ
jgi:chemotaxis protein MotB